MNHPKDPFWSGEIGRICELVQSSITGLSMAEAQRREQEFGPNSIEIRQEFGWGPAVWAQLHSPITLMLIFSAGLSFCLGEQTEASIILFIIAISAGLGVWQEQSASKIIEKLLALVQTTAMVWRDGKPVAVPATQIVIGDVLELSAGASVPADCRYASCQGLNAPANAGSSCRSGPTLCWYALHRHATWTSIHRQHGTIHQFW